MTLARLDARVAKLENSMTSLAADMTALAERTSFIEANAKAIGDRQMTLIENTNEILAVVSGMKKTGGFVYRHARKYGPHVVTAAITTGMITGKVGAFITSVLSITGI